MDITSIILSIFIPVITSILTVILRRWVEVKIQSIQNEKIKVLIQEGTNIILDCVSYAQQTYVDSIKESGFFGEEEHKIAFTMAKERAIQILPQEVYTAIDNRYGNLDTFVETVIESAIAKQKERG